MPLRLLENEREGGALRLQNGADVGLVLHHLVEFLRLYRLTLVVVLLRAPVRGLRDVGSRCTRRRQPRKVHRRNLVRVERHDVRDRHRRPRQRGLLSGFVLGFVPLWPGLVALVGVAIPPKTSCLVRVRVRP